jgi:excisionase family DNA binding protein
MDKLLNKKEVASLLGVSVKAIDKWVGEQRIPFLRLSRKCIRFRPSEIQSYLNKLKVKPGTGQ